jgi:uracil-DNA glycosylase family 4
VVEVYVLTHQGDTRTAVALTTVVSPTALSIEAAHALEGAPASVALTRRSRLNLDLARAVDPDPAAAAAALGARFADCRRCHLSERRDHVVQWRGNIDAVLVVVGDSPSVDDDHRGRPFVSPHGRLQDELFRDSGIDPEDDVVWMTTVGCRSCDSRIDVDRPPTRVEQIACSERTLGLLRALRPRVVLCLGAEAAGIFFDTPPPVNTWVTLTPDDAPEDWIAVGYARHPAYLMRSIIVPKQYKEYAAAVRFYRRLKAKLARLDKVTAWRFGLRYVETLDAPAVGG